jgi:hypothetical protein
VTTKKLVVPMNLAQALLFMGACYSERSKIGFRTITQMWAHLTDTQLSWMRRYIPAEALPKHKCFKGDLPYSKQSSTYECAGCKFKDKTVAEKKEHLTPWLPNIAHEFAKGLREGHVRGYDTYVEFRDPILKKPLYRKPARAKTAAKKVTAKKSRN